MLQNLNSITPITISPEDFIDFFLKTEIPAKWKDYAEFNEDRFYYHHLELNDDLLIDHQSQLGNDSVFFENVVFRKLKFDTISFVAQVHFTNCKVAGSLIFSTGYLKIILFHRCKFAQVLISETQNTQQITFDSCFLETLTLSLKSPTDTIDVQKCFIGRMDASVSHVRTFSVLYTWLKLGSLNGIAENIFVNNSRSDTFNFASQASNIEINFYHIEKALSFGNKKIEKIEIQELHGLGICKLRNSLINTFSIADSRFNSFQLLKFNITNPLAIRNTIVFSLEFIEVVVQSTLVKIEEVDLEKGGLLKIVSSDLGKTNFIKCNFSRAKCFFKNGKLQEIFLAETDFPKNIISELHKPDYGQAQLFFGQLQSAYTKQGDNIRSNDSLSYELEAFYQSLRWDSIYFFTKASLLLHRVSNSFGRSWVRGFIFSLLVGFVFFDLILISTPQYQFGISFSDALIGSFTKFMNPLRHFDIDTLFQSKSLSFTWLSYLFDFGGRIFVAYGYYQTIQAFRRYGKK